MQPVANVKGGAGLVDTDPNPNSSPSPSSNLSLILS